MLENSEGGLQGTLLAALNNCLTPVGRRRLRQWLCRPLYRIPDITARQDAVADLMAVAEEAAGGARSLFKAEKGKQGRQVVFGREWVAAGAILLSCCRRRCCCGIFPCPHWCLLPALSHTCCLPHHPLGRPGRPGACPSAHQRGGSRGGLCP